ncbi:MAG: hypothetical protein LIP28_07690 [Deltaproteobacteria bacterium]|nr:hypothetical protein [Deltaproteobacteria bacterium]
MKSFSLSRSRIVALIFASLVIGLWGCASPRQGPELPEVNIGVAEFTQPHSTLDMLAGYMAENAPRVPPKTLTELDATLIDVLRKETKRSYAPADSFLGCRNAKAPGQTGGRVAAFKRWIAVGNCMKVDFLLVPQVIELHEREGSEAGVTRPAGVILDFFLLDVKNAVLTSRSHFDETQTALADNLLDTGKFFSRGAKWISAMELSREGMVKAVKDMGL